MGYDEEIQKAHDLLRAFMFQNVYLAPVTNLEKGKACHVVEHLYRYCLNKPESMPELYLDIAKRDGTERAVCDYISGMTDDFAVDMFKEMFIPKSWT